MISTLLEIKICKKHKIKLNLKRKLSLGMKTKNLYF